MWIDHSMGWEIKFAVRMSSVEVDSPLSSITTITVASINPLQMTNVSTLPCFHPYHISPPTRPPSPPSLREL